MTAQSPQDEAAGIVGDVLAALDCLFTLNSTGHIDGLMDSTIDTLLGNSVEQLSKAYSLLTTAATDAERIEA